MTIGTYQRLDAWQSAMALIAEIYRLTARLPHSERFGLVQQMRRAAISISSNLAEGHIRRSKREFIRFIVIALGSLAELDSQLVVVERLGLLPRTDVEAAGVLISQTGRLLRGLERALLSRLSVTA
jgi:four helix bundle protein